MATYRQLCSSRYWVQKALADGHDEFWMENIASGIMCSHGLTSGTILMEGMDLETYRDVDTAKYIDLPIINHGGVTYVEASWPEEMTLEEREQLIQYLAYRRQAPGGGGKQ